ncbi:MAG: hypothetical protein GYA23_05270 [Methanomicrobiales archaeon]|nr:hypothetical protein [Methanomicrobiales archaeon]
MGSARPEDAFHTFLSTWNGENASIDTNHILPGTTAYFVRSFDNETFQFSFPVIVRRNIPEETGLDPAGADGAAAALIELVKENAETIPGLGPLCGKGTTGAMRYHDTIEPYTVIHSDAAIGSGLWKADTRNFCDGQGVHIVLRGAIPASSSSDEGEGRRIAGQLAYFAEATGTLIQNCPVKRLHSSWITSLDQKLLRASLADRGLVAFIGDGSRLARSITRFRPFYRVAGPKEGVNIPFTCPGEFSPHEIELPASNRTVTGLGIRRREVFAIAGSNAQGKTTFLEGILAGMDDHLPGDGREHVVTARGACIAESTTMGLAGADISMFFHAIPPGVSGTVRSVHGTGSGSMTMAHRVQEAITRHSPLLIIDEDRAAPNLLVKSCLQKEEITPLCEILSHQRERMGDTALIFAACAMDTLIAQADRIMVLDRHEASAIDRTVFRHRVADLLRRTAGTLE